MGREIFNLKSQEIIRKKLRHESTKAELLIWRKIRNKQLGCKFRRQHSIGKYIVDFICIESRLIIEIDGDVHFYDENIIKDKIREDYLKKLGFKIKRYKNTDILYNIDNVLSDLRNNL